ncbi:hypothetical protein [Mycobacterium sp.]|uniref:hypothetical protein n=1 Tax=Mycobacterium sp. TaxID=1785 RepID=UPI002C2DBA7E|nr:hypothetical protein [Mycobacterium sp.]HTQ19018.1 hypothetical protein [Mycobacterium sp.]
MAKVIITGVIVVLVLAGVIIMRLVTRNRERRGISSSLVKLYGLLSVAGFALLLAWSDADAAVKAARLHVVRYDRRVPCRGEHPR